MSFKCIRFNLKFLLIKGRHTAKNIKKQYDELLSEYELEDKVFKVVADQAANMKKALKDVNESTSIEGGANEDNIESLTQLLIERRRRYDLVESKKQQKAVEELNKSIEEFNTVKTTSKIYIFYWLIVIQLNN